MANKNKTGHILVRKTRHEERLVREIDKRAKRGERTNYDHTMQRYNLTRDGDRVWSF